MSAFLVSDACINRVVTFFACSEAYRRELASSEVPFDLMNPAECVRLAETLFALNCDVLEQHVRDSNLRFPRFQYGFELAELVRVYKGLRCWLYQCANGNIPRTSKLYQLLERLPAKLADYLLHHPGCSRPTRPALAGVAGRHHCTGSRTSSGNTDHTPGTPDAHPRVARFPSTCPRSR